MTLAHPFSVLLGLLGREAEELIPICSQDPGGTGLFVDWCRADEAAEMVDRLVGRNVWFGVQPTARPDKGRGTSKSVTGLVALYCDLDFADGKAAGMGVDRADAMDVVSGLSSALGRRGPNAIVSTGHGLQPYWAIERCDQVDGALLLVRWKQVVKAVCADMGIKLDMGVYDLPRILRVPGTVNVKAEPVDTGLVVKHNFALKLDEAHDNINLWFMASERESPANPGFNRESMRALMDNPGGRAGGDGLDRVFTDEQAADFLEENAWRPARETPWGGGQDYWKVIWQCAMVASHFVDMYDEQDLAERLRAAVLEGHGEEPDARDEYQIALGFAKGGDWLARRPSESELLNPFSPSRDEARIIEAQGPRTQGPEMPSWDETLAGSRAAAEERDSVDPVVDVSHEGDTDVPPVEKTPYELAVQAEAIKVMIREEARAKVNEIRAEAAHRQPPGSSLAEALKQPDVPVQYRVDNLLIAGGNAVLTAQFKAGKTTMMVNLVRSLADGTPFMDQFAVAKPDGRIGLWNYEVDEGQMVRWLRKAQPLDPSRVELCHLRGFGTDLTTEFGKQRAIKWLKTHGIEVWVIDPYGRALAGADENDNSAVGRFVESLDEIKSRAGVAELIMPAHTGRKIHDSGTEHARGATRIDDWPDARWILTKDPIAGKRYFRADGREVDVPEQLIVFDPLAWHIKLTAGNRAMAKEDQEEAQITEEYVPKIVKHLASIGERKPNYTELEHEIGGNKGMFSKALKRLVGGGQVIKEKDGRATLHSLAPTVDPQVPLDPPRVL